MSSLTMIGVKLITDQGPSFHIFLVTIGTTIPMIPSPLVFVQGLRQQLFFQEHL